jgi:KDO2-lipid IV(A) lauroyltransferase
LARAFSSHLIRSLWEFFAAPLASRAIRARQVRIENPEIAWEALAGGRGMLLMGGHTGSWGVALSAAMLQYPELRNRISLLVRPIRPALLRRVFGLRLQHAGIHMLSKRGSMNLILRRLADNQIVGFPMDQHASPREGIRVDFFGHPAWTFRSLAVVARRSGAPVVPAAVYREGRLHVFRLRPPVVPVITGDFEHDLHANTQQYNDQLEQIIRAHPEQWIWNHRRWKAN